MCSSVIVKESLIVDIRKDRVDGPLGYAIIFQ